MSKFNKVFLQGSVVRIKRVSEHMLTFTVVTKVERFDDWGQKVQQDAYVGLKAFGEHIEPLLAQLAIGRGVKIEAEIADNWWIDKVTNERKYGTDVIVVAYEFAPVKN